MNKKNCGVMRCDVVRMSEGVEDNTVHDAKSKMNAVEVRSTPVRALFFYFELFLGRRSKVKSYLSLLLFFLIIPTASFAITESIPAFLRFPVNNDPSVDGYYSGHHASCVATAERGIPNYISVTTYGVRSCEITWLAQ